ncbi:hypothetical protein [Streptomyces brevispora]|uniref:hypothetical protein n=1 Tax=Streptomyces brevispora TaxID=887462 RepID=UPI0035DF7104
MRQDTVTAPGHGDPAALGTSDFRALPTSGRTAARAGTVLDTSGHHPQPAADAGPTAHGFSLTDTEGRDRTAPFTLVSAHGTTADNSPADAPSRPATRCTPA